MRRGTRRAIRRPSGARSGPNFWTMSRWLGRSLQTGARQKLGLRQAEAEAPRASGQRLGPRPLVADLWEVQLSTQGRSSRRRRVVDAYAAVGRRAQIRKPTGTPESCSLRRRWTSVSHYICAHTPPATATCGLVECLAQNGRAGLQEIAATFRTDCRAGGGCCGVAEVRLARPTSSIGGPPWMRSGGRLLLSR